MMFKNKLIAPLSKALPALTLLVLGMPGSVLANVLQDISFSALPGNRVEITLTTSEPIKDPLSFTTDNPARIAIDLPETTSALATKSKAISVGAARSVVAIEGKDRTRVVINLLDAVQHTISTSGNSLVVSISGGAGAGSASEAASLTAVSTVASTDVVPMATNSISSVDFKRGLDGEGRIELVMSNPGAAVDMRQQGDKIILDVLNTALADELARTLDVTDFATPVTQVETRPEGNGVRMVVSTHGDFEHLAYQANNTYTLEFRPLSKEEEEARRRTERVFEGDRLSLNFQDIEVRAVLALLGEFTGLNMVVSDTVDGSITLRLRNVPWDQAMDIILKAKGLAMRRTDNVILVAPTEEIAAREKLELESEKQIEELSPLRSELIQVNYAKAGDLATLLKSKENKLLGDRGSVTIDERTNTLLVQDTAAKLTEIRDLVSKLDVPVRQVLIESRVVIAHDEFAKDLGVKLGISGESNPGGQTMIVGGPLVGDTEVTNPSNYADQGLLVNLPQTLAPGSGGAINFVLGKVGSHLLRLELSAMQQEGRGEVVSTPRVITSDQNKATIKQGVEIPYTVRSDEGPTIAFKDAVLSLDVTPHITPDDRIVMDLKVNKDSPRFIPGLDIPAIDTRSLETSVLVDNGETVVLGGVFERDRAKTEARVPFFGDLPAVGQLFRQTRVDDDNNELLIFVTPKILKDTLTLRR